MPDLYDGVPDARQLDHADAPSSRFRPRYRKLTEAELQLHDAIKGKAAELETLFNQTPSGRYRSLGLTALEEAVMWAIKGLTE